MNPTQLADPAEADEDFRLELTTLHVRIEVGPARDDHGVGAVLAQQACGVGDGPRREIGERRQPHHGSGWLRAGSRRGWPVLGASWQRSSSGLINSEPRRRPSLI